MSSPLTIVVGGYIVAYPLGGMTWHHLNYLLGLHELGHEVWFLEDSGSYSYPYNPVTWQSSADSAYGREYLERTFAQYGLPKRYCYYSQFEDAHYGLSEPELNELLKRADLLLCVSGVTPMREDRPRPRRTAVIDTDPIFTQLRMMRDAELLGYYRQFDAVATFGRLIGTPQCNLPTHDMNWIGTNQPIALRHWPVAATESKAFTTIGKWEHTTDRHLEYNGRRYLSSKGVQWMKMLDLPRRSSLDDDDGDAGDAGGDGARVFRAWLELGGRGEIHAKLPGLRRFHPRQRRRVHGGQGNLHGFAERLVQRSKQRVSGQRAAGRDAGQRL